MVPDLYPLDSRIHRAEAVARRSPPESQTTAQCVEFVNAETQAGEDGGLCSNDMKKSKSGDGERCEIRHSGESGSFVHTVAPEYANRPVNKVSFLDA